MKHEGCIALAGQELTILAAGIARFPRQAINFIHPGQPMVAERPPSGPWRPGSPPSAGGRAVGGAVLDTKSNLNSILRATDRGRYGADMLKLTRRKKRGFFY